MADSGIYHIINKVNGKKYIGSSVNVDDRIKAHKRLLKRGKHFNIHLQRSWNKNGEENFEFKTIETCEENKLLEIEQQYLNRGNNLYNIALFAGAPMRGRIKGTKNKEHSRRMSGKGNPMFGKKHSDETKEKIRQKALGREQTREARKKMSKTRKGLHKGEKHPLWGRRGKDAVWYGRRHSDETKEKISQKKRGEKSATAVLNWEKVNQIRKIYKLGGHSHRSLAKKYNVSSSCIYAILNNLSWRIKSG